MKVLKLDGHARRHFEFFVGMNHPHFSVCAPVDVTAWLDGAKQRGERINSALVYLLARVANDVPQFRRRIRNGDLVEHTVVHPSFAVPTAETDVFSFCEVKFDSAMPAFVARCEQQIQAMRSVPSIEDEPGRDDYLFMSALPWISFTAVTHPMHYHPHDSVPRITWGKITDHDERKIMPVSVQAHHAIVDGVHMGHFFERVEKLGAMTTPPNEN